MAACRYRNDVRAVLLAAGTPNSLYEVYYKVGRSKARVARAVLDELRARGEQGNATIVRVIEELCRLNKPQRDAPDQRAGYLAMEELMRQATAADILVSPERAAAEAHRAKSRRDARNRGGAPGDPRRPPAELPRPQPGDAADSC